MVHDGTFTDEMQINCKLVLQKVQWPETKLSENSDTEGSFIIYYIVRFQSCGTTAINHLKT